MKFIYRFFWLLSICVFIPGCIVGERDLYRKYETPVYSNRITLRNKCNSPVYYTVENFTKEQYTKTFHETFNGAVNFKIEPQESIHYTWKSGVPKQSLPFFIVDDTFRFTVRKEGGKAHVYTKDQILSESYYDEHISTEIRSSGYDYHWCITFCE